MTNKDILEYLKFEKENLIQLVDNNGNEFNQGRVYAMDMMIKGVEGILLMESPISVPIENLKLSVKSYNFLKRNGIDSVDELLSKTTDDFMRMRNLSRKSLSEIEMKIEEIKIQCK